MDGAYGISPRLFLGDMELSGIRMRGSFTAIKPESRHKGLKKASIVFADHRQGSCCSKTCEVKATHLGVFAGAVLNVAQINGVVDVP